MPLTRASVLPLVKETSVVLLQCAPPEFFSGRKQLAVKVLSQTLSSPNAL
jgi:hypothetical protein